MNRAFIEEIKSRYDELSEQIKARLEDFRRVPKAEYFYETAYCLLTPQSKAENAGKVIEILRRNDFEHSPFDCSTILRNADNYIRFHNTKAERLQNTALQFHPVREVLESDSAPEDKRERLVAMVKGFGMKEASHLLRNIGVRGLSILDRHILSNLEACGVLPENTRPATKSKYLETEKVMLNFATEIGIDTDELDLLFWCMKTGKILK